MGIWPEQTLTPLFRPLRFRGFRGATMQIVHVKEMRQAEERAMASGVSGTVLMERAGQGAAREIREALETVPLFRRRRLVALAGKGNNGGDAWVVARQFATWGWETRVCSLCPIDRLPEAARVHAMAAVEACVPYHVEELPETALEPGTVLIDGLLGIGVSGAPRGLCRQWMERAMAARLLVIAMDIPSGLNGDTGEGELVLPAWMTCTMGFPKTGLFEGRGPETVGRLRVIDLGMAPPDTSAGECYGLWDARLALPPRPADAHKNRCGHLLCLAGSGQYNGAAYLCAEAAMRCGAGLVTLAFPAAMARRDCLASLILAPLGKNDSKSFSSNMIEDMQGLFATRQALVFGPGIGRDVSREVLRAVAKSGLPQIWDADGLRLLAAHPEVWSEVPQPEQVVLTPHPGEMAALLAGFELDGGGSRVEQVLRLQSRLSCVVVLKGQGTLVAFGGRVCRNTSGTEALATAGTGDVLAGVIGALLAQGMAAAAAAALGVFLHGLAAERWPSNPRSLTADDLPLLFGDALNIVEYE